MSANNLSKKDTVIWLTGHSRGAAVSGIIAKYLIDDGYKIFSYNFATPNQVETDLISDGKSASSYNSIFNIINEDDLVPCLPLEYWGFKKYGDTKTFNLNLNDMKKWGEKNVDIIYNTRTLFYVVNSFKVIIKSRNSCYLDDNNYLKYKKFDVEFLNSTPELSRYYDIINNYDTKVGIYQKPIFYMQVLAGAAAGDIRYDLFKFLFNDYNASYYSTATFWFGEFSAMTTFMNPHLVDAYIIICEK